MNRIEFRVGDKNVEFRHVLGIETRAGSKDGIIGTLSGYAAIWDSESQDFGGWKEVIRKGAFIRSLTQMPDVRALHQHTADRILGRQKANTLSLREDDKGLAVDIDLIDTSLNQDILKNVRAGNLDSMSFGFAKVKDSWTAGDPYDIRELLDCDLYEVSVVTWPAYTDTEIAARSRTEFRSANPLRINNSTPLSLLRKRQALELIKNK